MKLTKREQIDELFQEASAREVDELINQYPSLDELEGKYEFSANHNKKMNRIFKKAEKFETNYYEDEWKKFGKFSFRAAAIICMIFTVLTMVAFAVPEIRVIVTNYVVEKTDEYTSINTDSSHDNDEIDGYPKYIPDGYLVEEIYSTDITLRLIYKGSDGDFIIYNKYAGETASTIDTEYSEYQKILINEYTGYLNTNNNNTTIIFHDGIYTYKLVSCLSVDETRRIAESIIN